MRRLWQRMVHPLLDRDGRRVTGHVLLFTGITRATLAPIIPLNFMSDWVYGALAIAFGLGVLFTSGAERSRQWPGRIVALLGSALLVAWAFDLGYRANGFWAFVILGFVLFREAVRG